VIERTPAVVSPAPAPAVYVDAEFSEVPSHHLRDRIRVLYKYRWLAATCVASALGVTVLVTLLTTRRYTASTRLEVARESAIQLRLADNVLRVDDGERNPNGTTSFLATQVAALRSRDLAERVIRTQRLAENDAFLHPGPERRSLLALSGPVLNLLRPRGWDTGAVAARPDAGRDGRVQVDPALLDRYMAWLTVQDVRGTNLVELRFTTPSPTLSAFLAAAHTQAYMEANEEAQRSTDVTAKDFLGRQLREAEEQGRRAEAAVARFATEHPDVAVDQDQRVVAQRIAEASTLLTKAEGQRIALQTRYEFLSRPGTDPLAYLLDRPGIEKLRLAVLEIRARRAAWNDRLGPNHPQIVELRQQEAEVAEQLRNEVGQEVAAIRNRYDAAVLREAELKRKIADDENAAIALRETGARYAILKGDAERARGLHESLRKQQMETAVNSELAASNVRVVERAEVPARPSTPNVPFNLTLGLAIGCVGAVGAAFACEYFDSSVKSGDEVEGLLQLPTLATIPNFALARRRMARPALPAPVNGNGALAGREADLVVLHEPRSPAAEAFRSLRTAVLFSFPDAPPKVIMVTSAGAGEGKTASCLNLAMSLAESGSRVVVVDVDLRRPACHRAFGLQNNVGLSNFLTGQFDLAGVMTSVGKGGLSFVPAGPTPPNPAELIGSARMRAALDDLRCRYDFVLLDAPPVLPVTDAVVLGREAEGVVLVVKGHDTPRELVRRARDHLQQAGARMLGVVVNNVDLAWGDVYFYRQYFNGYYGQPVEDPAA
jgi:capsular exopolysaccharide synthesis family protein